MVEEVTIDGATNHNPGLVLKKSRHGALGLINVLHPFSAYHRLVLWGMAKAIGVQHACDKTIFDRQSAGKAKIRKSLHARRIKLAADPFLVVPRTAALNDDPLGQAQT